jgi:hypothetical protein
MAESVMIGNVNGGSVRTCFLESLLRTYARPPLDASVSFMQASGLHVDRLRHEVARRFLDSGMDWLLFIDSDMAWAPEQVGLLLDAAVKVGKPCVVGAVCLNEIPGGGVGAVAWPGSIEEPRLDWEGRTGLVPVQVVGTAFTLYHAAVVATVREAYGRVFENEWLEDGPGDGFVGHDISFCWRVARLGFEVFADCDVVVDHEKPVLLGRATVE